MKKSLLFVCRVFGASTFSINLAYAQTVSVDAQHPSKSNPSLPLEIEQNLEALSSATQADPASEEGFIDEVVVTAQRLRAACWATRSRYIRSMLTALILTAPFPLKSCWRDWSHCLVRLTEAAAGVLRCL